jgi:hypothetical protein
MAAEGDSGGPLGGDSHRDRGQEEAGAPGLPDLGAYAGLLARRGETLLKALAVLHLAEVHLGVRWMTPSEIARLLGEIDDAHTVYRSNLSNALRQEQILVSRRPRGRGYEYGLTLPGRDRVLRELRLSGV